MSKQETITVRCDKSIKEKAKRDALKILGSSNLSGYLVYLINKEE